MISKAVDAFQRTRAVTLRLFLEERMSLAILKVAVSVEWQRLKPD